MRVAVEHSRPWRVVSATRGYFTVQIQRLLRHTRELFHDEAKAQGLVMCL